MEKIEITAPAGDFPSLRAAIQSKADSVYFGVKELNMRSSGAKNFKIGDLKKIVQICRKHNVKTYLTLNTIIYSSDFRKMEKIIRAAKTAGIDAVIASDIAVIKCARSKKISVHGSTQLNISNIEAVKHYAKFCDAIILARELTLNQIKEICSEIKKQKIKSPSGKLIKIEIFAHGALCVSIAGKCYMSLALTNRSANRGDCAQICRKTYRVIEDETNDELKIDNNYIMSPKDLCTLPFLKKILKSGISILKIEGRARPPEYVYTTVKVYKEAVNAVRKNSFTKNKIKSLTKELESVYNRGFWQGGYYLGKKLGDWAGVKGSAASKTKIEIGKIEHYFTKKKIAEITAFNKIKLGDEIIVVGPTTGIVQFLIKEIYKNGKPIQKSEALGDAITIPIIEKVRKNDKIFALRKSNSATNS